MMGPYFSVHILSGVWNYYSPSLLYDTVQFVAVRNICSSFGRLFSSMIEKI